jgi:hypothetical protein
MAKKRYSIKPLLILLFLLFVLVAALIAISQTQELRKKAAGGGPWTTPVDLSNAKGIDSRVAYDPKNNIIHVIWKAESGQLAHRYSTDGGSSWSAAVLFGNTNVNQYAEWPSLVVDSSGNAHVAYRKYDENGVYYTLWSLATKTWSQAQKVATGHVQMAIANDDSLHLVTHAAGTIKYYEKPAGGSWSKGTTIDTNGTWAVIAAGDGKVGIAWTDGTSQSGPGVKFRMRRGGTWGQTVTVNNAGSQTGNQRISYGQGKFHILFRSQGKLLYANDSDWKAQSLIYSVDSRPGDVVVDNNGTPHALWVEANSMTIDYGYLDPLSSQWQNSLNVFSIPTNSYPYPAPRMVYGNDALYAAVYYKVGNDFHIFFSTKSLSGQVTSPSPSATTQESPSPSPSPSQSPSGSSSPSPTATSHPSGSPNTNGCPSSNTPVCWDCNGDHVVNILDFSCFIAKYNQSY